MLMNVSVPQPPAALEYPWIQGGDLHGLGVETEVMQYAKHACFLLWWGIYIFPLF